MALRAGARLGGYDILAPIGAGGMGEVDRARDTKLGREVAIKVLLDDLARDPEHLARFEREAQLLASVNHPGIATLHGLEEADGRVFLVMELVPGETLAERLRAGPLPMGDALDGRDPEPLPEVAGGSHISFSPDGSRIMDVVGHKALWVTPLEGGAPQKVFEFEDPDVRIDYPAWSPDGRWVLFDRFRPQGGDIWMLESDPDSRRG